MFRPSLLPFWAGAAWRTAVGAAAALGVAEAYATAADGMALPSPDLAFPVALAAVAAYGSFEAASAQVRARASRITVEAGRILFETGYVSTATRSVWVAEVTGVDTTMTLAGRVAGYGDVTVEARGMDSLTVRRVAAAARLARLVGDMKDAGADPLRPAPQATGQEGRRPRG